MTVRATARAARSASIDATYSVPVQHHACLETHGLMVDYRGGDEANLIVNELIPLDELGTRYTTGIVVRVDEAGGGES